MKKGLMFVSALAAATLGLVACGGGGGGGTTTYTVAITNKDAIRTLTDEDMSKSVSVTIDGDAQKAQDALQDGDLVISSTNEQVLQISGVNKLKPVAAGETTVKAVYKGFEDSVTVTVTATPKLKVVTDPQEDKDYFLISPQAEKIYATAHMAEGNAKYYMAGTKKRDEAAKIRIEKDGDNFYIKATDPNQTEGKYFGTATNESNGSKHYNLGFFGNNVPGTDPAVPYAKALFHLTDDFHIQTHVDDSDLLVGSQSGKETISLGDANKVVAAYIYEEGEAEPATAVAISPRENVEVYTGGGATQLRAALTPASSTDAVTWKSSDVSKATVGASTGLVKGIAPGTVTITATALSGVKDEITVEVKDASTLSYGTLAAPLTVEQAKSLINKFEAGKTIPEKIFVAGEVSESTVESNYNDRNVWLKQGETEKAFEGYGVLMGTGFEYVAPYKDALKGATVTMTGWAMNYNGTYEITNKKTGQDNFDKGQVVAVSETELTGIILNKTSLSAEEEAEDVTLTVYADPGYAQLDSAVAINWSTNNPAVATVNDGVVSFVGAGEAKITATYGEGANAPKAECDVTVTAAVGTKLEIYFKDYCQAESVSSGTQILSIDMGEVATVTANKTKGNNNTGKMYIDGTTKEAEWRFYGSEGGYLKIAMKSGYTLISASILVGTSNWTTDLSNIALTVDAAKNEAQHAPESNFNVHKVTIRYSVANA